MRSGHSLFIRGIAMTVTLLLLCTAALANSGKETDEEGGVWDWDNGTYTAPDGRVVKITTDEDAAASEPAVEVSPEIIQSNDDGTITIINTGDEVVRNEDGSITVESGQLQFIE